MLSPATDVTIHPAASPLTRYEALVAASAVTYIGWRALANELTLAGMAAPAALDRAADCMARAVRQDEMRRLQWMPVVVVEVVL